MCAQVVFRERDGRILSVFCKRARGQMVRYAAQNKVDTLDQLQKFEGANGEYSFCAIDSSKKRLVFVRTPKASVENKKRATKRSALKCGEKKKIETNNGSYDVEDEKFRRGGTPILLEGDYIKKREGEEKESEPKTGRVTRSNKLEYENEVHESKHRRSTREKSSRKR